MIPSTWRLILTPRLSGVENMSLDDALLESVRSEKSEPILRLYSWSPFCLSLGYAQPISDVDQKALTQHGWDLVRRPTGGRAILHADELTYAVIGAADDPHLSGGVLASYRHLSRGLVQALSILGMSPAVEPGSARVDQVQRANPVCFEVPSAYEITSNGKKLIGSAQTRRQGAVLQHGTLPLSGDITRICQALAYPDQAQRQTASRKLAQRATTVSEIAGREISWDEAARAFEQGFSEALGITFAKDRPQKTEQAHAAELARQRYGHAQWTERV